MTVTIDIAPPPPELKEVEGEPGGITGFADTMVSVSATFDDLGSWIGSESQPAGWTGAASTSYAAATERPRTDADALSLALRRVSRACDTYAETLSGLKSRYDDLVERRRGLLLDRQQLVSDVNSAGEATDAEISALRQRAGELGTRIATLVEDHTALQRDVTSNDEKMLAAFRAAGSLAKVRARYGGVADPADAAVARPGSPLDPASTPASVNTWWDGLSDAEQAAVIAAYPELVGNTDGIPASGRDEANRLVLGQDLAVLRLRETDGTLTDAEEKQLENAEAAQDALDDAAGYLDPVTQEPVESRLYMYDPSAFDGDGRIALSIGDPDTADNVALQVPGFGTDGGSAAYLTERAYNIYSASRFDDPGSSTASIMWIGYDAPDNAPFTGDGDFAGVLTEGAAEAGGKRLADTVDGLRAGRDGDPAHLTVIGHSYGSTTTGYGASDYGLAVDDIVFVGSPGVGGEVDNASDLNIDPEHVWDGRNSRDIIATLGNHGWVNGGTLLGAGLGDDPSEDDFGANRFQAEATDRGDVRWFGDHSKYFDPSSESLYNISQIVNGDYGQVQSAEQTYDPWYDGPQDPEWDRDPTATRTGP